MRRERAHPLRRPEVVGLGVADLRKVVTRVASRVTRHLLCRHEAGGVEARDSHRVRSSGRRDEQRGEQSAARGGALLRHLDGGNRTLGAQAERGRRRRERRRRGEREAKDQRAEHGVESEIDRGEIEAPGGREVWKKVTKICEKHANAFSSRPALRCPGTHRLWRQPRRPRRRLRRGTRCSRKPTWSVSTHGSPSGSASSRSTQRRSARTDGSRGRRVRSLT